MIINVKSSTISTSNLVDNSLSRTRLVTDKLKITNGRVILSRKPQGSFTNNILIFDINKSRVVDEIMMESIGPNRELNFNTEDLDNYIAICTYLTIE